MIAGRHDRYAGSGRVLPTWGHHRNWRSHRPRGWRLWCSCQAKFRMQIWHFCWEWEKIDFDKLEFLAFFNFSIIFSTFILCNLVIKKYECVAFVKCYLEFRFHVFLVLVKCQFKFFCDFFTVFASLTIGIWSSSRVKGGGVRSLLLPSGPVTRGRNTWSENTQ